MRRWTALMVCAALMTSTPQVADAGVGSLFAKLGKVASKGGVAKKAAALSGKAKLGGVLAGLAVSDRALLAFKGLPGHVADSASFVARENGQLRVMRSGANGAVDAARLADSGPVVLDASAALDGALLKTLEGRDVFIMDATGSVRSATYQTGSWVVDGVDVTEFALDQMELEDDEETPWWVYLLGGGVALTVVGWKVRGFVGSVREEMANEDD